MQRVRSTNRPPLSYSVEDINQTGDWTTFEGKPFLLIDDTEDGKRIFGFSTIQSLGHIHRGKKLFGDGTFSTAPPGSCQLYTIHGYVGENLFPLAHFLLPPKHEQTYVRMFTLLRSRIYSYLGKLWKPSEFQLDYEKAAIEANKEVFGSSASVKVCLFHFTQCILRKKDEFGFNESYNTPHSLVRSVIRCCMALPFVRPQDVSPSFESIMELLDDDDAINTTDWLELTRNNFITEYVYNTWTKSNSTFDKRMAASVNFVQLPRETG